jgi:hypothetical protein
MTFHNASKSTELAVVKCLPHVTEISVGLTSTS